MAQIDFFKDYCQAPVVKLNKERPRRAWEALEAEMWIWSYFSEYYKSKHGSDGFVIAGLSYLTMDYRANTAFKTIEQLDPDIVQVVKDYTEYYYKGIANSRVFNIILKWMRSDFNNLNLSNKSSSALRARKPDIMGVHITGGAIIMELLEVTTDSPETAAATIKDDLESKKNVLERGVKPLIEKDIREQQSASGISIGPDNIEIIYSKWKPSNNQMVVPLLTSVALGKPRYEWICYKPTLRYNNMKGQDGLILYEIHSVGMPQNVAELVPMPVIQKLAAEVRARMRKPDFDFGLNPFLQDYWKTYNRDEELLKAYVVLGMGIALVIILAVVLLPAVIGSAEAAEFYALVMKLPAAATRLSAKTMVLASGVAANLPKLLSIAEKVMNSIRYPPLVPQLAY